MAGTRARHRLTPRHTTSPETTSLKNSATREELQNLVLSAATGQWGCEDMTGVIVERCDPAIYGRNWHVTHLQNEDLPAARHTVLKIVECLGQQYNLEDE